MSRPSSRVLSVVMVLALFGFCGRSQAQDPLAPLVTSPDSLERSLGELLMPSRIAVPNNVSAARTQSVQELQLVWEETGVENAAQTGSPRPYVSATKRSTAGAVRLRSAELSVDKLLVVSVDANGVLREWTIIQDPRWLRSESSRLDGILKGEKVPLRRTEFLITLPDDPTATELRFFQPRWIEKKLTLEQVWAMPFGREDSNAAKR